MTNQQQQTENIIGVLNGKPITQEQYDKYLETKKKGIILNVKI